MAWVAHTNAWTLAPGASIWLIADAGSARPRKDDDLSILLVDGAVIDAPILRASATEIHIELFGYTWRLTPAAPRWRSSADTFPGAEWILRGRVKG